MKKTLLCFTLFLGLLIPTYGQIKYAGKIETSFLAYLTNTITVDADFGWKGYHLDDSQNGIDFNIINGISIKKDFFIGVGLGYLNFQGIHGYSIFSDFEYSYSKPKVSPLTNVKIGYNRIFNQYEGGSVGVPVEIGFGVNYKWNEKIRISAQSGFLLTQQSFLIPLRVGVRF